MKSDRPEKRFFACDTGITSVTVWSPSENILCSNSKMLVTGGTRFADLSPTTSTPLL